MKPTLSNKKIGVFYDGNYWSNVSNYYNFIHPLKARLSIAGLHTLIASEVANLTNTSEEGCLISEAHFFKSRCSANEARERGNQLYYDRVVDDILMYEGIMSHNIPVRGMYSRNSEKELAVAMAITVCEIAVLRNLDVVVLVASDVCYVPLFRKLRALGISVVLLSWSFDNKYEDTSYKIGITPKELIKESVLYLPMEEVIEEGLKQHDELVEGVMIMHDSKKTDDDEPEDEQTQDYSSIKSENREIGQILTLKSGYGFVKYPNNNLFFHYQDVIGDFSELAEGDIVEFAIGKNKDGDDVAKDVAKLKVNKDDDGMN